MNCNEIVEGHGKKPKQHIKKKKKCDQWRTASQGPLKLRNDWLNKGTHVKWFANNDEVKVTVLKWLQENGQYLGEIGIEKLVASWYKKNLKFAKFVQ